MKKNFEVIWHDQANGGQSQQFLRFPEAEQLYNDIWQKPNWYNVNVYNKEDRPKIKNLVTGEIIKDI